MMKYSDDEVEWNIEHDEEKSTSQYFTNFSSDLLYLSDDEI